MSLFCLYHGSQARLRLRLSSIFLGLRIISMYPFLGHEEDPETGSSSFPGPSQNSDIKDLNSRAGK